MLAFVSHVSMGFIHDKENAILIYPSSNLLNPERVEA